MAIYQAFGSRLRGRRTTQAGLMAEINVTPFVDVMLVLLIVFMVAAPLLTLGVPLDLPRGPAQALPTTPADPLTINVDGEGRVHIGNNRIADAELGFKLRAIAEERGIPDRVYIHADRTVPYGRAMWILSVLSSSGFESFGLVMGDGAPESESTDSAP